MSFSEEGPIRKKIASIRRTYENMPSGMVGLGLAKKYGKTNGRFREYRPDGTLTIKEREPVRSFGPGFLRKQFVPYLGGAHIGAPDYPASGNPEFIQSILQDVDRAIDSEVHAQRMYKALSEKVALAYGTSSSLYRKIIEIMGEEKVHHDELVQLRQMLRR